MDIFKRFKNLLVFIIVISCASSLWAIQNRAYEPVILTGDYLSPFYHVPLENLVAYQYSAVNSEWTQIAFQIDDRWSNGNYAFDDRDNELDSVDEVLILAKDFADPAPATQWIDDVSSTQYPRVQLEANDPVSGLTGYVYVYRTDDPSLHTQDPDYISYSTTNDKITSAFYEAKHTNTEGILNSLLITGAMGGNGLNIVDRLKLRLNVSYNAPWPVGTVTLMVGEDILRKVGMTIIDGDIRVIRKWRIDFELPSILSSVVDIAPKDYIIKYYPTSSDMGSFDQLKFSGFEINYIRVSVDMNSNANGMHVYNVFDYDGALINHAMATDDNNLGRNLDLPGWNWWMQTGNPGTFLTVAELPDLNNTNNWLYYKDATSGTDDSAWGNYISGNYDTGSDGSWGDTGVKYWGTLDQNEPLSLNLWFYFLGPNLSPDSASTIMSYHENPIGPDQLNKQEQNYIDAIEPAQVVDLHITDYNDDSISLAWTAPGDDGNDNGPAAQYQLRYQSIMPTFAISYWWNTATVVNGLPDPAEPGQVQTFTVTGLNRNKDYYFLLRTVDESGNISDYSNATGESTTPVELALFTAQQKEKSVLLNWMTETETNNLGFAIERKESRTHSWTEIGFVHGGGTRSNAASYSFVDKDISGLQQVVYRLKQIDTDGSFHYSKEITVKIQVPDQLTLFPNYPNPFNPSTRISYQVPDGLNGRLELVIYDVLGRRIRSLIDSPARSGYFQVDWDGLNDFSQPVGSGEYFCVLKLGNLQHIQKMIKLH